MAYYLQMDGVDDNVVTPSFSFDTIEIDFATTGRPANFAKYFAVNFWFVQHNSVGTDSWDATGWSSVFIDGAAATSGTDFVPDSTRITLKAIRVNSTAYLTTIFKHSTASGYMKGLIYGIKFYLGGIVVAHYDMTLGNVQDQSGNGRHATLIGGTWINDGPTGVDVTYNYSMNQKLFGNTGNAMATKQVIQAARSDAVATRQTIWSNRISAALSKQALFSLGSINFVMLQMFFNEYVPFVSAYPLRIGSFANRSVQQAVRVEIWGTRQEAFNSKQQTYRLSSTALPLRQVIVNAYVMNISLKQVFYAGRSYEYAVHVLVFDRDKEIVKLVKLEAARIIRVELKAARKMRVELRGES